MRKLLKSLEVTKPMEAAALASRLSLCEMCLQLQPENVGQMSSRDLRLALARIREEGLKLPSRTQMAVVERAAGAAFAAGNLDEWVDITMPYPADAASLSEFDPLSPKLSSVLAHMLDEELVKIDADDDEDGQTKIAMRATEEALFARWRFGTRME